jgi:hypothetical protein
VTSTFQRWAVWCEYPEPDGRRFWLGDSSFTRWTQADAERIAAYLSAPGDGRDAGHYEARPLPVQEAQACKHDWNSAGPDEHEWAECMECGDKILWIGLLQEIREAFAAERQSKRGFADHLISVVLAGRSVALLQPEAAAKTPEEAERWTRFYAALNAAPVAE